MAGLAGFLVSSLVAWGVHAVLGPHVSFETDFVVQLFAGALAYLVTFVWIKKLRGWR